MGMIECIKSIAEEFGLSVISETENSITVSNGDETFCAEKGETEWEFPAIDTDFGANMMRAIDRRKAEYKPPVPAVTEEARNAPVKEIDELTIVDVKQYINADATDKEAYAFLQLCSARKLNPFLKEAHLIIFEKNGKRTCTMVVGKDAFTKRAEEHPMFDGFQAGVIVKQQDETICFDREGTFVMDGEVLLGGWAIVYRKDKANPYKATVSMSEYKKGTTIWTQMPATMIRKVALVQALREAIPSEFSGMYDKSEMGVE